MMRNEVYLKLAPSMLKLKSASIRELPEICHALHDLGNSIAGHLTGNRLEGAVARRPRQCLGWSWLALWKARMGCSSDVFSVLEIGLQHCKKAVLSQQCTVAELAQAMFLKGYIEEHMTVRRGSFDSSLIGSKCNQSFEQAMASANTMSSSTLSSILSSGQPTEPIAANYMPYSYLTPQSDSPRR